MTKKLTEAQKSWRRAAMGSNVDRWRKYAESLERDYKAAGEEIAQLRAALAAARAKSDAA